MSNEELLKLLVDDYKERKAHARASTPPRRYVRKKGMEFSKKLMVFAALLCGGTWVVAAVAWLIWREFPSELVQYTGWFFGAVIAYLVKSGYENKPKIERGREEELR